ncbi:hypothetical protein CALVIDRAFT_390967 [Calocera viscosa TUFC12733]|uniref:Fungal-type protein kinase domain-containing protein n=1 Tax=Calocera viscosa (strain TUFC12733) TaxID=1330018 RepID=A0A167GGV6_CALVF|nr:hypothetical protein CALVIDRAFT_390967 [Calocera viscosa TUFC12733]
MLQQCGLRELPLEALRHALPRNPKVEGIEWGLLSNVLNPAFNGLPGTAAYNPKEHEDVIFAALVAVFQAGKQVCEDKGCDPCPAVYVTRPTRAPGPSDLDKPDKTRPDGQFVPSAGFVPGTTTSTKGDQTSWLKTNVMLEAKVDELKDLDHKMGRQNTEQAIWGLGHALYTCLARRWSWGITIEGTTVRIWLAHRGGAFVSTPFHLIQERNVFMDVFMRLAYGSPNELGWDTGMQPLDDAHLRDDALARARQFWQTRPAEDGSQSMDPMSIYIDEKRYILIALISDGRARPIRGSGCRVFVAYPYPDTGHEITAQSVVIKIVWRHTGRESEGVIYKKIIKAIEDSGQSVVEASKYLVPVIAHSELSLPLSETIMKGVDTSAAQLVHVPDYIQVDRRPESIGTPPMSTPNSETLQGRRPLIPKPEFTPTDRVCSAYVMANIDGQVAKPLHHEGLMDKACSGIADVTMGLKMLALAEMNHRDMSVANILIGEDGHARLSDNECAKPANAEASSAGDMTSLQRMRLVRGHGCSWRPMRTARTSPSAITRATIWRAFCASRYTCSSCPHPRLAFLRPRRNNRMMPL